MQEKQEKYQLIAMTLAGTALLAAGAALADSSFGAIALSPQTGHYGLVVNRTSRAAAERDARSRCQVANCRTTLVFKNACGAIVRKGNVLVAASGSDRQTTLTEALQRTGKEAKVITWECSKGAKTSESRLH